MEEIKEFLTAAVAELCGIDEASINDETKLIGDLSMKSSTMVVLVGKLEEEYDIDIDFMKFRRAETIAEAAEFLDDLVNG